MTTINVRIDEKIKIQAGKILSARGLNLSSGVNVFLRQVIEEKGLPFTPGKSMLLREKYEKEIAQAKKGKTHKSAKSALNAALR